MAEPETALENLPVGEYLKTVREERGLGLDEASQVTKIGKNYLQAMEAGEFDKLPSAAYIKGFLRLYAEFLSLSGNDVVARYENSLPKASQQATPGPQRSGVEVVERAKNGGPGRWVIPAVLLVLVIMAAIFFSPDSDQKAPRQAPTAPAQPAPSAAVLPPRSSVNAAAQAPAAVLPPRSSATAAAPAPAASNPPAMTASAPAGQKAPGGVVLRLRFTKDSWLSITIDDSISQRYDLKAGDIIEWKGSKAFVVDVGDGGAVDGEFNGRPLKTLGEAGKPAHVELKGS
ncbi:MAG TPA: RodZ domain-containing protein [Geomonas sp.]|nr:RodZ domain-containing protein [Geomonas sp.]